MDEKIIACLICSLIAGAISYKAGKNKSIILVVLAILVCLINIYIQHS